MILLFKSDNMLKQLFIFTILILFGCSEPKSGVVRQKIFTPSQTSLIVTYTPQNGQPNLGVAGSDDTFTLMFNDDVVSVTKEVFFAVNVGDSITLTIGDVKIHKRGKP